MAMSFNLEGFDNTTEALGLYVDFGNLLSHRLNKRGGKLVPFSSRDFDFGLLLLFLRGGDGTGNALRNCLM